MAIFYVYRTFCESCFSNTNQILGGTQNPFWFDVLKSVQMRIIAENDRET